MTVKTLTAVQQRRRERILHSTRDQLSQVGYEGLNMRELAVIADVSTSTLYNLYQSKDALILAALEDQLAEINAVVVKTNTSGLGRYVARVEAVADQIVETPKYAEAMGKMLFSADAQDPIVQLLIGTSLSFNREELAEMAVSGELRLETDRDFLARLLSSVGWSTVLMWMKGYVALHDFKQEYVRNAVTIMLPYVTQAAELRLRQLL
ncbi:MAG: TetR/AcrR family transcriptional regulator [Gammaproteobacteria bacterium]|jgi:AcrR family transcriptional regulator|nr:TetR/AcrR family transcriptional regulator [Gammaproteobacteria bacterium]MBT5156282.1 TetR/AcrR family transcriptional regulator [Gammaproteobacteria bacterium]MBT5684269.1 TetR/AcrR family transcriptional regulator [Gammaproteobacteria bacterium]MBT6890191.1 TetR/AcrR family transcriptional regulator [Gammaproteobacteria bacterium]MBT7880709.1 TetR/AcrR family transcriptional regulator [Gammaproteobacteria bacterium]